MMYSKTSAGITTSERTISMACTTEGLFAPGPLSTREQTIAMASWSVTSKVCAASGSNEIRYCICACISCVANDTSPALIRWPTTNRALPAM